MNKKSYIFCFVIFTFLFITSFALGEYLGKDTDTKNVPSDEANAGVISEQTTAVEDHGNSYIEGYWIRTEGNFIVIYNHEGTKISNTEINIEHFSDSEKKILSEGIYVETAEDLFRHLESYTS